jgi:hypothetical protein
LLPAINLVADDEKLSLTRQSQQATKMFGNSRRNGILLMKR